MSMLDSVPISLRDWGLKDHPVTISCAGCGELTRPLKKHYCTSVVIKTPVDIVINRNTKNAVSKERFNEILAKWRENITIGNIFIIYSHIDTEYINDDTMTIGNRHIPEAYIHEHSRIAEDYILIDETFIETTDIDPYNFFSCNLIPLLLQSNEKRQYDTAHIIEFFQEKGISPEMNLSPVQHAYGSSKSTCKDFFAFIGTLIEKNTLNTEDYRYAFQQWAYAKEKGILAKEHSIFAE